MRLQMSLLACLSWLGKQFLEGQTVGETVIDYNHFLIPKPLAPPTWKITVIVSPAELSVCSLREAVPRCVCVNKQSCLSDVRYLSLLLQKPKGSSFKGGWYIEVRLWRKKQNGERGSDSTQNPDLYYTTSGVRGSWRLVRRFNFGDSGAPTAALLKVH